MILHIQIDDVLKTWVRRWASYKGVKGYPNLQSFSREMKRVTTRYAICDLGDDCYLEIDNAVDVLRQCNLSAYQVLMAVFLQGYDKREICDTMGISPRTYDNYLRSGRDFMEGAVLTNKVIKVWL